MTTAKPATDKLGITRKSLIKEMGLVGAIALAIGVVMILTGGWEESAETERVQAQSLLSTVQSEVDISTAQMRNFDTYLDLYTQLEKARNNTNFTLDRTQLQEVLATLRQKYRLSDLNLQMDPETPVESELLRNNQIEASSAVVQLTFGGMTDQHLYSFIQDFLKSAPAFVKITQMTLKRNLSFDVNLMRQISKGEAVKMVSAEMKFEWIGFSQQPKKKKAAP